eukprot:CAMPEP_0113315564 /NCGR_PEP_ID=MMETSP0010_2-20120614/11185_1 /TAXON_ID=216773 ORGANISM="Corethron hystrix, Strain 308" /NCGR_SAMPLE_ID=MMETSP0010_2 /ASSEMBLY_ACC=CAM_ASM_000155 /LENGTH=30 /DNA_ID=CAMNT_0000172097 /DNA_START=839 /DNA_END=931 /DNA_ORIENTATION=- /assembly_acc=CAM_ASM_000155
MAEAVTWEPSSSWRTKDDDVFDGMTGRPPK